MAKPVGQTKPAKPYPEFPLYAHGSGRWAKKVQGKVHYYGPWNDWEGALKKYLAERDYQQLGMEPPATTGTLGDLLNSFRDLKQQALQGGELSQRTFSEYEEVWDLIAATVGKMRPLESVGPLDLAKVKNALRLGKKGKPISPVSHKRLLTYARMPFRYANEELGYSVRYKQPLSSPKARELRKARNEVGERLFTAEEIRGLIKLAKPQLRAMIYLGINCGFGNRDCATMPIEQVDVSGGWHTYWRPKTQVARRCPLWPETAAALYAVIQERESGLVFRTKYGNPWNSETGRRCPISYEFRKLVNKLEIHRIGITTFYSLRRTFETIGATAGEQHAVDVIMGHVADSNDMAAIYRQKTYDAALLKVTDRVRAWLLGEITL